MAHKRFITSSISIDEKLAKVAAEDMTSALLWPWLLFEFDDWGRAECSPMRIRLARFPAFPSLTTEAIEYGISLFIKHGLTHQYEVRGKSYWAVRPCTWIKHQNYLSGTKRAGADSSIPAPLDAPWSLEEEIEMRLAMTRATEKDKAESVLKEKYLCQLTNGNVSRQSEMSADISRQTEMSVPSPSPSPSPSGSKDFTLLTESVEEPASRIPPCPHQEIQNAWNQTLNPIGCHHVQDIRGTRRKHLTARWRENSEMQSIKAWEALFGYIRGSCPFLVGREHSRDRPPFFINIDWLVNPTNFQKIREGQYEKREGVAANVQSR